MLTKGWARQLQDPASLLPPPPASPPCIYDSLDYGRDDSECGIELGGEYAETVELIYDHEAYDVPGWFSATATHNPLMTTEEQCQSLCHAHPDCDYFSYEYELLDDDVPGVYAHECFLKAAYVGCTADDTDEMAGYGPWTSDDPSWVGHSGPEVCPGTFTPPVDRSCLLTGMDYGGGEPCGYATTLAIYADHTDWTPPGWFSGAMHYNTLLSSANACQDLCDAYPGCDFFSYEWENTSGTYYHECYLKQGFSYAECPYPVAEQYAVWEYDAVESPDWHGVSGPAACEPPPPATPSYTYVCGCEELGTTFCNYDYGGSGECEPCAAVPGGVASGCDNWGLPAAGAADCHKWCWPDACIHDSLDYGRDDSECGIELGGEYAETVELIYDHEAYDVPGWFSATATHNPLMTTEEQCQSLCHAHPDCDYFSYEYELLDEDVPGVYAHECFLKAAYVGCTADDTDEMAGYGPWTSDDPSWVGHSGPEVCPGVADPEPADRSCLLTGMDYGGGEPCGYATTLAIYADHTDWTPPGWFSGAMHYNTLLADANACQDLCDAYPGCDFFSYEWENTTGTYYHECYLKQGFSYAECPHPLIEQYAVWAYDAVESPDWHGVSGPAVCEPPPPPCLLPGMDYGGGDPCGYATTLAIYADHTDWTPPGWFSGEMHYNTLIADAAACQALCAATAGCDYFSYEWENTTGTYYHECYLKQGLTAAECPYPIVEQYAMWEYDAIESPDWHGVSGPAVCTGALTCDFDLNDDICWVYESFGTIITHECGLDMCPAEGEFLEEEIQSPACSGSYAHKVTLVLDGGNIDDGTFNQLAYEGALAVCTEEASCCLEVDRVDADTEVEEEKFFCELEYAATDSGLSIGVGFLHEQSVHRAATCMPDKEFGIVDVAYTASLPNLEGLTFADDQAGYLAGVIAGGVAAAGSKKLGVIGGLPITPVLKFINGFANGVAYSCADCTTTIVYCPFGGAAETTTGLGLMCPGEFADVAFGVAVAQYLIGLGVDVIFGAGGLTGSAGIAYAAAPEGTVIDKAGATSFSGPKLEASAPYVVGVDKDEYYTTFGEGATPGADKLITSALKNVDAGVSLAVSKYFAGTSSGSNVLLDASNGGVGFAPAHETDSFVPYLGPVTPSITAAATTVFAQMSLGQFDTGIDSTGAVVPTSPPPPPAPTSPLGGFDGDQNAMLEDDDDGDDNGAVIGGVLGGVLGVALLVAVVCIFRLVMQEKKGQPVFKPTLKQHSGIEVAGTSSTADTKTASAASEGV